MDGGRADTQEQAIGRHCGRPTVVSKIAQQMVGVAQLVEPRVVIPVVVGSNPIAHPILINGRKPPLATGGRVDDFAGASSSIGRAVDS